MSSSFSLVGAPARPRNATATSEGDHHEHDSDDGKPMDYKKRMSQHPTPMLRRLVEQIGLQPASTKRGLLDQLCGEYVT